MMMDRSVEYLVGLVRELCILTGETEWVEFKVDRHEPEEIGEYISALANSAALAGKAFAHVVWGVADENHAVVGTDFKPSAEKVGNEELESWLLRLLAPKLHFRFHKVSVDGRAVVLLEIGRAFRHPVKFRGQEYIRVGSYKKKLKDFPEKERALWRVGDQTPFEDGITAERVPDDEVLRMLDYPAYFELLGRPLPANRGGILDGLAGDDLIHRCDAGGWKTVPRFPEPAVRELVANALIHQDFFVTGAGPMVEIFEDRIEITNPGASLVDTRRLVDSPPRSRNEAVASLMRRIGICEERGSGWDKVVFQSEVYQLPAPLAEVVEDHTRVVLFGPRALSRMDRAERVRAVYFHACLRYVNGDYLTNTSLRQRFGIDARNSARASRLIAEAIGAGAIVPDDPSAGPKFMRYVPEWANPGRRVGT